MVKQTELRNLLPAFLTALERDGVVCDGLKNESFSDFQDKWVSEEECLFAVLRQAIDFHIRGDLTISLRLLQWLIDHGLAHALVMDNFIRVLVASERFCEALACLPRLEALDQGEILDGVRQCLATHVQTLLGNIRQHVDVLNGSLSNEMTSENILLIDVHHRIILLASNYCLSGHSLLALVILEELKQWGVWCWEALSEEAKRSWALLVVRLGSDVLNDITWYDSALLFLKGLTCEEASWQLLLVDVAFLKDLGDEDQAQDLVLKFLSDHLNHREARTWIAAQQLVDIRADLRESAAESVRDIDQAYARDALILDYFLKLIDSDVLVSSDSFS